MEYDVTSIGGSGGGGVPAHAPLQDPILSFSHTFSLKSAHVGGQTPPPPKWVHAPPPLRKILDPALSQVSTLSLLPVSPTKILSGKVSSIQALNAYKSLIH